MFNNKKLAVAVMTTALTATMVSAHLPSASVAKRQMGRRHANSGPVTSRAAVDVSKIKPWSSTLQPKDQKEVAAGFYCSHKTFGDQKLYWKASWWPETSDEPGEFADSGGTSCWALQNSAAFNKSEEYQWVGWNSNAAKWEITKQAGTWIFDEKQIGNWGDQIDKKGPGAYIPTWRDGAEGAYSMIHDDIGAMSFGGSVQPANEVGYEHSRIRVGWGVKVDVMKTAVDPHSNGAVIDEFAEARQMVMDGHEMLNHSWDHTSAADLWDWFDNGETLPTDDPALPEQIRGMKVGKSTDQGWKNITFDIPYVRYPTGTPDQPETLTVAATYQVSEDYKTDSIFTVNTLEDTYDTNEITAEILESLGDNGWIDTLRFASGILKPIHKIWSDDSTGTDGKKGKEIDGLKVFCGPGWDANTYKVNIEHAKKVLDENVYMNGTLGSTRFPEGKVTDYYVYPYDSYSKKTHDALRDANHIGSRGGAKSGMPIPGDFFHPFRIDFDAFFMMNATADLTFEDGNEHQRLSLQGLVERVIKTKGYMIREFHACADVEYWDDANNQSKGGWWGGIPKSLYKEHFVYLDRMIDEHKVTVFTPTEAVKYRLTANSATDAKLSNISSSGATLTVTASGCAPEYQDEMSVIVKFDQGYDALYSHYSGDEHPRRQPVKMTDDGKAWSVSLNPYKNNGVVTLNSEIVANSGKTLKQNMDVTFAGIQDGRIALNLPAGNYTADIFNVAGRKIKSVDVSGINGRVQTGLSTTDLGAGMFILNVSKAGASVMQHKFLVK